MIRAALISLAFALPAQADVVQGESPDPLAELNALYGQICRWDEDTTIPFEVVDISHDGVDDYLLSYDLPCRGQDNAFAGVEGMARQIWISRADGSYLRILDVNTLGLEIEMREGRQLIILQQRGGHCMTAPAAPCFITFELSGTELVLAPAALQHPSMDARMRALESERKETEE